MEEKVKNLELEIKVLKERINVIEKREVRRRNLSIIKFVIKLIIVIVIALIIYDFYQKAVDFFNSFPIKF